MEKYLNKTVRVLVDGASYARHPTEPRYVQKGDLITITRVTSDALYFQRKDLHWQVLRPTDVELVGEPPTADCSCKSLLNGHEFGCKFYKEL